MKTFKFLLDSSGWCLLVWHSGWILALAIFLIVWGNNIMPKEQGFNGLQFKGDKP